jgi:hypothetical protein
MNLLAELSGMNFLNQSVSMPFWGFVLILLVFALFFVVLALVFSKRTAPVAPTAGVTRPGIAPVTPRVIPRGSKGLAFKFAGTIFCGLLALFVCLVFAVLKGQHLNSTLSKFNVDWSFFSANLVNALLLGLAIGLFLDALRVVFYVIKITVNRTP